MALLPLFMYCNSIIASLQFGFFLGGGGAGGGGGELKITFVSNLDNIIAHNLCKNVFFR